MDLATALLELVLPTEVGDELVSGARLTGASTELGPRLSFEVGGRALHVEVAPVDEGRPHVARSRHFAFAYRSEGAGQHEAVARTLCQAIARAAAGHETRVLELLARGSRSVEGDQTKVREVIVERLIEPAGFHLTLSPYVGCLIGCRFCYAQTRVATARRLEGLHDVPWGSFVDVRVNAPEVLKKELERLPVRPIKFCPVVSDPYQAVEKRYQLTRHCLEVIGQSDKLWPTLVLTRSALVERDLDVLSALPTVFVGTSLPTIDDEVRRHFEPRGASIGARLQALKSLRSAGVETFAVVQPILPGSVAALAEALAEAVSSVSIDVLHGVIGAEREFSDPRYAEARDSAWQLEQARALARELGARGVELWQGELPPALAS